MLRYYIAEGEVESANRICLGIGYSGAPGAKNDPTRCGEKDVGPIPPGVYRIGAPVDTPTHGPFVLPLTPLPGTDTLGRGGFLVHGDSIRAPGTASHGCIVVRRSVREAIWNGGDHLLEVVPRKVQAPAVVA